MAKELEKRGYRRSWEKCRDKVKKLKQEYKKVVDNNSETGRKRKSFKFFGEMDSVLGHRPAIIPPVVILSTENGQDSDVDEPKISEHAANDDLSIVDQVSLFL